MKLNVLILGVLLAACTSQSPKYEVMTSEPMLKESNGQVANETSGTTALTKPDVDKKKIIKDGSIILDTKDIQASKKNIDTLLKQFDAYYERENSINDITSINYTLNVRVPSSNFERLLSALDNGKDEVMSKTIQARDVTEEYIDVESRLNNERAYLQRYKELLAKASSTKDILLIEENIRKVQEEIDSREGRLKYLQDQVAYSTLEITLLKNIPYKYSSPRQDPFGERVKRSLSNGWKLTVGLALFIVSLWPFLIIAPIVIMVVKRIKKKRKNK